MAKMVDGGKAPEGFSFPKAAADLINIAALSDWDAGWVWDEDLDQNPFLKVHVRDADSGEYFTVTWHSRDTGTLRLFSKLHQKTVGGVWTEGPSVKAIVFRMREVAHQRS